jgi:predicted SPOUT superfamily RNA methylase MTH1
LAEYSPRRPQTTSVAIPASLVADTPHLREKTYKVGLVGRACAIFRVENIIIYPDIPQIDQARDAKMISGILTYMETPQYLRKHLVKLDPNLRYAGILPPIRTPHHPLQKPASQLKTGEIRDGVVVEAGRDASLIYLGTDKLAAVSIKLPRGSRVTVRVGKIQDRIEGSVVPKREISIYWGYNVSVSNLPLGETIKEGRFDLVIATSRYGRDIGELLEELKKAWNDSTNALIAFGAPKKGLREILAQEDLKIEDVAHFNLNTVPVQAVETVRTEEAVLASLAIINLLG